MLTTTPLYHKIMSSAEAGELCCSPELEHHVWDPTPWIIDVYTCGYSDLGIDICEWCDEHIGPGSSPIHNRRGNWHRALVTVDGWTWIGFDTEQHMLDFIAAWPDNVRDLPQPRLKPTP